MTSDSCFFFKLIFALSELEVDFCEQRYAIACNICLLAMGRVPLGDCGCSNHEAGEGAWTRKPNVKSVTVVAPSRRRPYGAYSVLDVGVNATDKEITTAYRQMALKFHPDKCQGQARSAATVRMQQVNDAFDTLKDPKLRAAYDAKHKLERTRNSLSSVRVAVHRSRLTETEKKVASAIDCCRKKLKAKKTVEMRSKKAVKRIVVRKKLSKKSKVLKSPDHWVVFRRSKKESGKDKRKKGLLAVPDSCVKKKRKGRSK